jgi:hypothetical protein
VISRKTICIGDEGISCSQVPVSPKEAVEMESMCELANVAPKNSDICWVGAGALMYSDIVCYMWDGRPR